jgi:hypothetical protein
MAIKTLPDQFQIKPLKLFGETDEASLLMQTLVLDDEKALKLMHFFADKVDPMTFDDFIDIVEPSELHSFVEEFWEALANFSGPLKKPMMIQMWKEFKKSMQEDSLLKMNLSGLHSESSPGE